MKKFMLISIFLISNVFVTAQPTSGVILTRKNQGKKIRLGIRSGELTQKESKQLIYQQKLIQLQKKMMKEDGIITKKERARLKQNQARAKANIYDKKHN